MCERNSEEGIFSLLHLTCHTSDFMPTLVCRAGANYYMAREMVQSFHGHREFIVMWVLKQYNLICILGLKQSQFGIQNSLTARWCGPKSKPSKMESGGGSSVQTEILSPSEAAFLRHVRRLEIHSSVTTSKAMVSVNEKQTNKNKTVLNIFISRDTLVQGLYNFSTHNPFPSTKVLNNPAHIALQNRWI